MEINKPTETRESDLDREFVYAQFDFWLDQAQEEGYSSRDAADIAATAIGGFNESPEQA